MSARLFDNGKKVFKANGGFALKFPFEYKDSASTDVKATLERVRKEQQAKADEQKSKVQSITRSHLARDRR